MFCKCGAIVPIPKRNTAVCRSCGRRNRVAHQEVVFEKTYHNAADAARMEHVSVPTIHQTCPKCGAEKMQYNAIQTRSADEGQTVFYHCTCGYTMKVNT